MGKIFSNGFRFWALGFGLVACFSLLGQDKKENITGNSAPFETGFDLSWGWNSLLQTGFEGGPTKGIDFFIEMPLQSNFSLQMGMGIADYQFTIEEETKKFTIAKLKMYPRFWISDGNLGLSLGGFLGFSNLKDPVQKNGFTLEDEGFTLGPIFDISYRVVSLKHLRIYASSKTSFSALPVLQKDFAGEVKHLRTLESVLSLVFTYR